MKKGLFAILIAGLLSYSTSINAGVTTPDYIYFTEVHSVGVVTSNERLYLRGLTNQGQRITLNLFSFGNASDGEHAKNTCLKLANLSLIDSRLSFQVLVHRTALDIQTDLDAAGYKVVSATLNSNSYIACMIKREGSYTSSGVEYFSY